MAKQLSELEIRILSDLASSAEWKRPHDLGGTTKSPHSRILKKLAGKGLVEKKRRSDENSRSGYLYRITVEGQAVLGQRTEGPGHEGAPDMPGRHDEQQAVEPAGLDEHGAVEPVRRDEQPPVEASRPEEQPPVEPGLREGQQAREADRHEERQATEAGRHEEHYAAGAAAGAAVAPDEERATRR